ncbi:CAAX protease self-immunity [Malonomonas rubra DSM 5091]|uniref:CAAX protease self-immunity n=1 Tax=Malonomonas rubra DSM 5091 TaxID=1122189 RepID=A0A1M6HXK3_MALRU|nr:CAAX protease self-immunity [Malonomonas rubra DSM 5091]
MSKPLIKATQLWVYILVCFSLTVLACALKYYLVCAVHTSSACRYLCPSFLAHDTSSFPIFLNKIFDLQVWVLHIGQNLFGIDGTYKNLIFSNLIMAPVVDELIYRGPLFLLKNRIGLYLWWFLAVCLCVFFAIGHKCAGLSLFPLIIFGLTSSWLVMKTKRFWPCIALHFLYNFQAISLSFYQSFLWGS